MDGNKTKVEAGKDFYAKCKETRPWPPKFLHAWITKDNINDLLSTNGFSGEIDLLSLDLDGNDYWIWESLNVVDPRVVILEYQNAWRADECVTQRYQEDFQWKPMPHALPSCGASLGAFAKLGRQKGYRLVGCQRYCFNAIFLREDVCTDLFPEVSVESCLTHPAIQFRLACREEHPELMRTIQESWVEV